MGRGGGERGEPQREGEEEKGVCLKGKGRREDKGHASKGKEEEKGVCLKKRGGRRRKGCVSRR